MQSKFALRNVACDNFLDFFRWWNELDLVGKLGFGRDRPSECFLWTVGTFPAPHHSNCRIELTKTVCILLVMDDIFDTYGSLDELILFTEAIKRCSSRTSSYIKLKYSYQNNFDNNNNQKIKLLLFIDGILTLWSNCLNI